MMIYRIGNIQIHGANTLKRYTEKILKTGFEKIENVDIGGRIYQIHGSPEAKEQDKEIIKQIVKNTDSSNQPAVILVHRPDEIQELHPALNKKLKTIKRTFGLVFLGNLHLNDEFFNFPNAQKKVIPHGFFSSKMPQENPFIIGTSTTWGEMRSTDNVLKLLSEVFAQNKSALPIIGYLGGKPKEELDIDNLSQKYHQLSSQPIKFIQAKNIEPENLHKYHQNIIIDSDNILSDKLLPTFNTQIYHYKDKVRTGESSGSLHSGVSIPVIAEMNGSEIIEDLNVIKIPYCKTTKDVSSLDYKKAAKDIINLIKTNHYKKWLEHNNNMAKKFNDEYIAKKYIELIKTLT